MSWDTTVWVTESTGSVMGHYSLGDREHRECHGTLQSGCQRPQGVSRDTSLGVRAQGVSLDTSLGVMGHYSLGDIEYT